MHKLQCQCGSVKGQIETQGLSNRLVCYCRDCQAFAQRLAAGDSVLDGQGGTEIVQLAQARLQFTEGQEHIAALRLSEGGLVRWYAACCNTPLGNTLANPKLAFVGLIHSALDKTAMDSDFGTLCAHVNVDGATSEPKPKQQHLLRTISRFMWIMLVQRLSGRYRKSPFFTADGELIVMLQIQNNDA